MIIFPRLAMQSGSMDDANPVLRPHELRAGPAASATAFRGLAERALANGDRDAGDLYSAFEKCK